MRRRDHVRRLEPDDAQLHVRQRRERDQAVELAEHDRRRTQPVPQRRLGQDEVKPLVGAIQDLLALDPGGHGLVDVVTHLENGDTLREASTGVLGGLKQPRDERRLEGTEEPGPSV